MQTNQLRSQSDVEMALDGIPHTLVQLGNGFRLGKDRFSDSACQKPPLGGLLDYKNDLGHLVAPGVIHYVRKSRATHRVQSAGAPSDPITSRLGAWMARMATLDIVQKTRPPHWK
jgi:hypothetical protein